jgi:hypothetical protein
MMKRMTIVNEKISTPPWNVILAKTGSHGIESANGWMVALTKNKKDAFLIAAAPELLEGLKLCHKFFIESGVELEITDHIEGLINKAKGL